MATDPDTGITYKRQRTGPLFAGYFNKIGLPGVKALDENGNPLPDNPWEREQIRFDGDASQLYWPPDMFIIENSILYLRTKNEDGSYSRRRIGLIDQNLDEVIRTGDNAELNGLDVTGPIDFQTDQIAIGNPNGSNRHTGLPQIITDLQNGLGNIDLSDVIRTGDDALLGGLSVERVHPSPNFGATILLRGNTEIEGSDGFFLTSLQHRPGSSNDARNPYDSPSFRVYVQDKLNSNEIFDIYYNPGSGVIDYASGNTTKAPTHVLGAGALELAAGGAAKLDTDSVNIGDPDGDNRHEGLAQIITDLQNQVSTLQSQVSTLQDETSTLQNETSTLQNTRARCVLSARINGDGSEDTSVTNYNYLGTSPSAVGEAWGIYKESTGRYTLIPGGGLQDDFPQTRFYLLDVQFLDENITTGSRRFHNILQKTVSDGSGGAYFPAFEVQTFIFSAGDMSSYDSKFDIKVLIMPNA